MKMEDVFDVAKRCFLKKYRKANVALAAGSIIRGEGTKYSDIDFVVIFEKLPCAYRESFIFEDMLFEAFVHDPKTLKYFFEDERKKGRPALPQMVLEGIPVPSETPISKKWKSVAHQLIQQGPPKLSIEELNNRRYFITDAIDDLRDPRNQAETNATAAKLHETLADFWFRAHGHWTAGGKTIPRAMHKISPKFAAQFDECFRELFSSENSQDVIQLAERILKPFGGFLFDGYKRKAPSTWKLK